METFPEQLEKFEEAAAEHELPMPEKHPALPANAEASRPEKHPGEALAEARKEVAESVQEQEPSRVLEELKTAEEASEAPSRGFIRQELHQLMRDRGLRHLQRQENLPERQLSRLIHQPAVRAVSEAAGKTVSRPSGLLGGGLLALLGTSAYLYLAKHIGFTYNYGVFLLLFVGGFVVGLALELVVHLGTRRTFE